MAVSSKHTGWRLDRANARLDFYYEGTRVGHIDANGFSLASDAGLTLDGDLTVDVGTHSIEGADLSMPNLPTSNPAVAGQLWANTGVVTVSAG